MSSGKYRDRVEGSRKGRGKAQKQVQAGLKAYAIATNGENKLNELDNRAGDFVKSDRKRDTLIELKKEYLDKKEPFGKLYADQSDLEYLRTKKEEEQYVKELSLAQYMISNDPATREQTRDRLFSLYPEIRDLPEQIYKDWLATQIQLRTILRDGVVKGKDEHRLIIAMMQPDYLLPLLPVWDHQGDVCKKFQLRSGYGSRLSLYDWFNVEQNRNLELVARKRGLFNPLRWVDQEKRDIFQTGNYPKNPGGRALICFSLSPSHCGWPIVFKKWYQIK